MSDFLSNIADMNLNLAETLQPKLRSTFEPLSSDTMNSASQFKHETAGVGVHSPEEKIASREDFQSESANIQDERMNVSTSFTLPLEIPLTEDKKMNVSLGFARSLEIPLSETIRDSIAVHATKEQWHEATITEPPTTDVPPLMSNVVERNVHKLTDQSRKFPKNFKIGLSGRDIPKPLGQDTLKSSRMSKTDTIVSSSNKPSSNPKIEVSSGERLGDTSNVIEGNYKNHGRKGAVPVQDERENQSRRQLLSTETQNPVKTHKRAGIIQPSPLGNLSVPDYIRASSYIKPPSSEKQMAEGGILVSIGRIEVRSSSNAPSPQRKQDENPGSSAMGLNEYLYRRAKGGIG